MDEIERMRKVTTALEIALKKSETYQPGSLPNPKNELQTARQPVLAQHTHAGSVILGETLQDGNRTGKTITLGVEEMFAGLHVSGVPRHGKSAFLINLFLQLAEQGYGAAFIDPHSDAITDILARLPAGRADDVILLDPTHETHSFPLQLLTCDNVSSDTALTYAYNQLWSVCNKVWADKETGEMGIWMQKFVSNAILTFLEHPGYTVADIPLLLTSKPHREYFAKTLKNSVVARFWTAEFDALPKNYQWVEIESTLTRLNRFLQNPLLRSIVGQSRSTLNFRTIMDTKKLLLVHFPVRLPEDFRTLLGTMLITQLQDAMFSRMDTPKEKRVPFFLIVDEVQEVATKQFTKFFEEGGKYHVATIAAHQHLFQEGLNTSVRNGLLTAGNKVYVRVSDTDADIVAPGYAKAPEEKPVPTTVPRDVLPYLRHHEKPFVQRFWAHYLAPFDQALEGEGIRYDKDVYQNFLAERIRIDYTIYPSWNFGSGEKEFDPKVVRKMRIAWGELLFETMQQQLSAEKLEQLRLKVIIGMSDFLDFYSYARYCYDEKWKDVFCAKADRSEVDRYERVKDQLRSFLASETELMRFYQAFKEQLSVYSGRNTYERGKALFYGDYPEFNRYSMMAYKQPDPKALPAFLTSLQQKPAQEAEQYIAHRAAQHHELSERHKSIHTYLASLLEQYQQELTRQFPPNKKELDAQADAAMIEKLTRHGYYHYFYEYMGHPPDFLDRLFKGITIKDIEARKRLQYEQEIILGNAPDSPDLRFTIRCPLAEARAGLVDETSFLRLLSAHSNAVDILRHDVILCNDWQDDPWRKELHEKGWRKGEKKPPVEIQRVLAKECALLFAKHEPFNTREKILAVARTTLEGEISEIENRLQKLYGEYKGELAYNQMQKDQWKAEQKSRYDRFVKDLDMLLALVMQPQYIVRVPVSNFDHQPRREKTEREMIDTAARELRNLPKYQAFCKLVEDRTTASYHIALPPLPPPHRDDVSADMTKRIWSRMETDYYRTKKEIEEEIAKRQKLAVPDMSAFAPLPARQRKQGNGAKSKAN